MRKKIIFGSKKIGDNERVPFISEIGVNHLGKIKNALELVESAVRAGSDFLKFQTYIAEERYDKKKHSREFPIDAIKDCLKIANIKISDVDEIALNNNFYEMIKNIYLIPAINDKKRLKFLFEDIERIKSYDKQEKTIRGLPQIH